MFPIAGRPNAGLLLSGETQFGFLVIPLVQGHLKTGRMRALGLSARKRSTILPDIPTLHETGSRISRPFRARILRAGKSAPACYRSSDRKS